MMPTNRWLPIGLSIGLAILLSSSGGRAATPVVSGGGQLLGASNVDVGGTLFNVVFAEGTCADLFSGCDEASDFTFTNQFSAQAAAQALLDQVFLDSGAGQFDTEPELTSGCSNAARCDTLTPYQAALETGRVFFALARNRELEDAVSVNFDLLGSYDTGDDPLATWAVWTVVPEPGTGVLVGAGLATLAAWRRRGR